MGISSYITKSFFVGSKDTCVVHRFLDMSTLISVFYTFFLRDKSKMTTCDG